MYVSERGHSKTIIRAHIRLIFLVLLSCLYQSEAEKETFNAFKYLNLIIYLNLEPSCFKSFFTEMVSREEKYDYSRRVASRRRCNTVYEPVTQQDVYVCMYVYKRRFVILSCLLR